MSTTYKKPDIKTNHSNLPTFLFFIAAILLYGWGTASTFLILLDKENQPLINDFLVKLGISIGLAPFVFVFLVLYIPIMLVLAYILLKLISWLAQEITIVVSVLFPLIIS